MNPERVKKKQFSMPQSLSKIYLYIIFGTINHEPYLDESISDELCAYLTQILKNHDSNAIAINAANDHVHILCELSKNLTVPEIIEKIKTSSSKWIKTKATKFRNFHWQSSYGVFSVSPSLLDDIKKYIANQREHHRKKTFQEEFRQFLKKYNVTYDERYVWD